MLGDESPLKSNELCLPPPGKGSVCPFLWFFGTREGGGPGYKSEELDMA